MEWWKHKMFEIQLYYATVTDNDDQNHDDATKKGRIQVRLLPEMNKIDPTKLPWVRPFVQPGMSASNFSYISPEVDDKIWVIFTDKYFKEGYYLCGSFIDGFFSMSTIDTALGNITESITTTYPDLKFYYMVDGSILFWNTSTGDKGFYNKNGMYVLIDNLGKVYLNAKDQDVKIYNTNGYLKYTSLGVLENNGSTKSLVTHTELNTALQAFQKTIDAAIAGAITGHMHATAATGPPSPGVGATSVTTVDISSAQSDRYKED